MIKGYYFFLLTVLFLCSTLFAQQYKISGTVTSATSGDKLPGANVYLKGTNIGAASDERGYYEIIAEKGHYTIVCSYIGYETVNEEIDLTNNLNLNFALKEHEFTLSVTVISNRARERETPVAFSDINKADMETRLGSRDIPLVLNTTPSVYATQQGGGAGDSRIDIRGYKQNNIGVMLNGVPINDMNNGWVYWSNWDGIGDATSSVQVQRGLSAINLAVPSIGGTMNIITDPTQLKFGVKYKQEFGTGSFLKSTASFNSGLINGKFAFSGSIVRKTGNGVIDRTWTDAWAYYFGASYNVNDKNRLEIYAIGAPQRHGQNSYRQNIAAYDSNYAKSIPGFDIRAIKKFPQSPAGRYYNENWNYVDPSYKGKQFWNGTTHDRYDPNFINEKENYYNKPLINLNWYTQLSKKLSLYSTLYYSGGKGGGSSTYGSMKWIYPPGADSTQKVPSRIVDWNGTIAKNKASRFGSLGILVNAVNNQWTVGALSKGYYKLSDELTASFGIDWRIAQIDHFEEVRDLLGGEYFNYSGNAFDTTAAQKQKRLGDKLGYWETNDINWLGVYLQGEYTKNLITLYGMYGWTIVNYKYTNNFLRQSPGSSEPLTVTAKNITGFQLKGGASYRLSIDYDVFANAGYVSKVPIYNDVIDYNTNSVARNLKNEQFISFEAGINSTFFNKKLTLKTDYYYTTWKNQAKTIGVKNQDGSSGAIFLTGMNSLHTGLEFELAYQSSSLYRLDGAFSIGYWKYTNDPSGVYQDYANGSGEEIYNFYVNGLMVGDAPQTQLALQGSVYPTKGMQARIVFRYNANYYADWDPFSRTNPNDRAQVWKTPAYSIWDVHFYYKLPINIYGVNLNFFAHVFNLFNTIYIQDATDNSQYNSFNTVGNQTHSASDAEVYLGMPRTFNIGITFSY
ncbi:TonB-dependent receptor [Melioribacteraceae bacterium 4301-Me]|uniref:TonB-dependent receptor n=1 Tax=Pyranulibacter aquaticus TaxID=3163344 RepID=UPI00359BD850